MADAVTAKSNGEDSRDAVRNFILFTVGMLLLVAWHVYDGFKYPEIKSAHFLRAGLLFLLAALFWIRRLTREGLAFKPTRGAHWIAAFYPVLVVATFLWSQQAESQHLSAKKERDVKYEAWQQAIRKQTEIVHQASKEMSSASARQAEAWKTSIDTSDKLTTSGGKPAFRLKPEAARRIEETEHEFDRALAQYRAESARLLQVEQQRPLR